MGSEFSLGLGLWLPWDAASLPLIPSPFWPVCPNLCHHLMTVSGSLMFTPKTPTLHIPIFTELTL